jgi:hypothetical protein
MLASSLHLNVKKRTVKHLNDEDREYVIWCLSLEPDEFRMMLNSLTDMEAAFLLNLIQLAKEELFDDEVEKYGTPDADDVINYIKNTLD